MFQYFEKGGIIRVGDASVENKAAVHKFATSLNGIF